MSSPKVAIPSVYPPLEFCESCDQDIATCGEEDEAVVVGVRYCSGVRLASTAAVGPPCSHRQSSPNFVVYAESMASVGIVLQALLRAMASVPASTAAAIGGFSLLLLCAYFLKGGGGRRQGKNSNLRPLPGQFGDPCVWVGSFK